MRSPAAGEDALKVIEGRQGYLFLANDANRVIDQIEGRHGFDAVDARRVGAVHRERERLCAAFGARYFHVVAPDRETVLARHLPPQVQPGRFGPRPMALYLALPESERATVFYRPELLSACESPPSFFVRDTHWTWHGGRRYLDAIAAAMGTDTGPLDADAHAEIAYHNPGDLGSKLGLPPEASTMRVYRDAASTLLYDNALSNMGRVRLYANPSATGGRIVVLHDSFGEWWTTTLPRLFSFCAFIHAADFDFAFVNACAPTHVVMLQVERFFRRLPVNDFDLIRHIGHQFKAKGESQDCVIDAHLGRMVGAVIKARPALCADGSVPARGMPGPEA